MIFDQEEDEELRDDKYRSKSTNFETFVNIVKSNIGSGILGMPFAFRNSGVLLGVVGLFVIFFICVYCVELLVISKRTLKSRELRRLKDAGVTDEDEISKALAQIDTYSDITQRSLGTVARIVLSAALVASQVGACCAYFVFIGENMYQLSPRLDRWHYILIFSVFLVLLSRMFISQTITATLLTILLPVVLRSMKHLSYVSLVAEVALVIAVSIIIFQEIDRIDEDHVKRIRAVNWFNFPTFFAISVYSFEGSALIIPIESNMRKPSNYMNLFTIGMGIISVIMVIIGVFGYIAFGENVNSVITLNLPSNAGSDKVVKIGLIVALLLTCPIALFPIFEEIDVLLEKILSKIIRRKPMSTSYESRYQVLTHETEDFDSLSPNSNTTDDEMVFNDLDRYEPPSFSGRLKNIFTTIWNTVTSLHFHLSNVIRLLTIVLIAAIASLIPDFGFLLSITGGLSGVLLSFSFPCAIHLWTHFNQLDTFEVVTDLAIMAFTLVLGVGASIIAMVDLIAHRDKYFM